MGWLAVESWWDGSHGKSVSCRGDDHHLPHSNQGRPHRIQGVHMMLAVRGGRRTVVGESSVKDKLRRSLPPSPQPPAGIEKDLPWWVLLVNNDGVFTLVSHYLY